MVYDDLGIYRLFALGEDDHDVKRFVREWLGPLLDYDATSRSDLVGTLWQYFESGGNYDPPPMPCTSTAAPSATGCGASGSSAATTSAPWTAG